MHTSAAALADPRPDWAWSGGSGEGQKPGSRQAASLLLLSQLWVRTGGLEPSASLGKPSSGNKKVVTTH